MEKLNPIKKEVNTVANIWKNLLTNIKREKLLSISNIIVMSVTFTLLGVFIYVVVGSQTALRYLEQQAQVSVFFKDDFPEENIMNLKTDLQNDNRVSSVNFVSKEDAFKIFSEINKDEPILLESISPSVLPASLEIRTSDIANLSGMAEELSKIDGVEDVRFFEDVIERFRLWSRVVYIVGFVLVVAFLMISYSVVIATLRTTINSKGVELEIMKLVGASNNYVKNPLIYQGVFFGLVSSLVASLVMLLLVGLTNYWKFFPLGVSFGFLPSVFISPFLFFIILALLLIISGVVLGFVGSFVAVRRYLRY